MRLAIYHPWVYLRSGIERSFAELLARSRHDWTIYTHHHEPAATYPELRDAHIVQLEPEISVRRSIGPLLHAATTIARTRLPLDGERALLVSSEGLGDFVMARAGVPAVCYCHTPLKILHDPATRAALRELSPRKFAALRLLGGPFSGADRRMWARYRHVLANSAETAARIGSARLAPVDGVEVLRPGVDLGRFGFDEAAPRDGYFLVAGRIMWQKNIELAIDALRAGLARGLQASLVVAGAVDEKSRPYLAALRERAAGLPVRFEVDPPDSVLAELYRRSLAVLFTARNEDWGMVPLEAMASGAPVLAVDAGGPKESVVDGVTGWLLPADPEVFARQMRTVAAASPGDLAVLRRAARDRAAQFGWEGFARRIDDVMEEVASTGRVTPAGTPMTAPRFTAAPRAAAALRPASPTPEPAERLPRR